MTKQILSLVLALSMAFSLCAQTAAFYEAPEFVGTKVSQFSTADEPQAIPDPLGTESAGNSARVDSDVPFFTAAEPVIPADGEITAPNTPKCKDGEHNLSSWVNMKDANGHWLYCSKCYRYILEQHTYDENGWCQKCGVKKDDYSGSLTVEVSIPLPETLHEYMTEDYYMVANLGLGVSNAISEIEKVSGGHYTYYVDIINSKNGAWAYVYGSSLYKRITFAHGKSGYYPDSETSPFDFGQADIDGVVADPNEIVYNGWYYYDLNNGYPDTVKIRVVFNYEDIRGFNVPGELIQNLAQAMMSEAGYWFDTVVEDYNFRGPQSQGEAKITRVDIKPVCSGFHRYENGVCTVCGTEIPTIPEFDLSSFAGLDIETVKSKINEVFGNAVQSIQVSDSITSSSSYISCSLLNPLNPNDVLWLYFYYEDGRVYQISPSAGTIETSFFDNLRVGNLPALVTYEQMESFAASNPQIYKSTIYPSFDNGYYPDEAFSSYYTLPPITTALGPASVSANISNYDGSPSTSQKKIDYSILISDDEFKSKRFPVRYYVTPNANNFPESGASSISLYGETVDVGYDNFKAACPGLRIVPSNNYTNLGAYKFGQRLLYTTESVINRNLVISGYTLGDGGSYNYLSPFMKGVAKALPAIIDGFKVTVPVSELSEMGAEFTSRFNTYNINGEQGYYQKATVMSGNIAAVYLITNTEVNDNNYMVINNNLPAYLTEVIEVPDDYSDINITDFLDVSSEEILAKLNAAFGEDVRSFASSDKKYSNQYSFVSKAFMFIISAAGKTEKIEYRTYVSESAAANMFYRMPMVSSSDGFSSFNTSRKIKNNVLNSHSYTMTSTDYDSFYYRRTEGIEKMKSCAYKIDMGDYYLEVSYPNYAMEYVYDESGRNIIGRRINTERDVNYSISYLSILTKNPEALIPYAVKGGYIYIDPVSGTVVKADPTVTKAEIPVEVDGVNVTGIGPKAFSDTSVSEIYIPVSVRKIAPDAFDGCTNLTITYQGSETAWANLFTGTLDETSTVICLNAVRGDFNGDGAADVKDGVIMQRILAEVESDPSAIALADLNGDGITDVKDGVVMQQILAELE